MPRITRTTRVTVMAAWLLLAAACGGGEATPSSLIPPEVLIERIADDADVFGGNGSQRMHAVAVGTSGLVGVGVDSSGGDLDAAVWTSTDGSSWQRVTHDEDLFGGGGRQVMNGVVAGGPGFVAVGSHSSGSDRDAVVWTSVDGSTWERVDADSLGGPGLQQMRAVTVGGPGLVAVGSDQSTTDRIADAAVWTSSDGLTWTRVAHVETVFGQSDEHDFGEGSQVMHAITVGGPGLVAVGSSAANARANLDAAVWTSEDGLNWTRVDPEASAFVGGEDISWDDSDPDVTMTGIEATDSGLVAVGWIGTPDARDARAWTSSDGIEWSLLLDHDTVFGGDGVQMMSGIDAADGWLVAVGADDSAGSTDAAIWVSTDGLAWARLSAADAVLGGAGDESMSAVAVLGPSVIPVGVGGEFSDPSAAVWIVSLTAATP